MHTIVAEKSVDETDRDVPLAIFFLMVSLVCGALVCLCVSRGISDSSHLANVTDTFTWHGWYFDTYCVVAGLIVLALGVASCTYGVLFYTGRAR